MYILQGDVELLKSDGKVYVSFGITKKDILSMLLYLAALEYKRMRCFFIRNDQICIKFTFHAQLSFEITTDNSILSGVLKKEQVELIKCCCIDNSLWGNYNHVDFEHELCDFTFRILQ